MKNFVLIFALLIVSSFLFSQNKKMITKDEANNLYNNILNKDKIFKNIIFKKIDKFINYRDSLMKKIRVISIDTIRQNGEITSVNINGATKNGSEVVNYLDSVLSGLLIENIEALGLYLKDFESNDFTLASQYYWTPVVLAELNVIKKNILNIKINYKKKLILVQKTKLVWR